MVLAAVALAACVALLISDLRPGFLPGISTAEISAVPLFLAGIAFLFVQSIIRPRRADLLKNLLLAATFLLWGAVQLMPQNALSRRLGNLVIVLYVLDLAWATFGAAGSPQKN